ncbi:hypothetical protein [Streptomyces iconiensis]|uniref:Lipoprotein n=1 Tax=Streptomyces iconiensis TaxID=1384038 RepID=A0ABT7AAI5_9ACTN|nr:hypothetical protein [Streptomyces iconiensis]MDJ1138362.1 hypothetical protein [Streptomyces iconiensis]
MAVRWHGRGGAVAASVLAGAVGMTLLTVTGCSEGGAAANDGKPDKARPDAASVRRAADTLRRAGSSRVRTSMETTSGGTRVTIEGRGSFDFVRRTGKLRVALPRGAEGARPGERRPVTELIAPGALYMKNRGAGVPPDKWVRVATSALPDGNLVTGGATDPVSAAELLRGARHIVYEGVTELRGERVWHFSGVVDMEAAAVAAPPHAQRQLRAAEKGFSGNGVPFDAYLDGQGRLRKVQHRFTFAAGPTRGDEGVAVLSTTVLDAFGTRVRVVMPASRDIYAGRIATP